MNEKLSSYDFCVRTPILNIMKTFPALGMKSLDVILTERTELSIMDSWGPLKYIYILYTIQIQLIWDLQPQEPLLYYSFLLQRDLNKLFQKSKWVFHWSPLTALQQFRKDKLKSKKSRKKTTTSLFSLMGAEITNTEFLLGDSLAAVGWPMLWSNQSGKAAAKRIKTDNHLL